MSYSLYLKGEKAVAFKKAVKERMRERNMTAEELAEATCYSVETIRSFFKESKWNRFLASSIADELGIDLRKVGESDAETKAEQNRDAPP